MTDVLHGPTFDSPVTPPPVRKPWYRRPLVILPIVVAVVAAAVVTTVVLVVNMPVRVTGTVLDSLTGNPVASATISASGRTTTADARGAFTLDKVEKHASVTISSANYAPTEIKATSAAATVRLAPIPVHATVTSALTTGGLSATLTLPDGTLVTADSSGVANAYHVGPGDKVTVSAEGYVTATVAVNDDRTVTATLQPTFATVGNQLVQWSTAKQDDKVINWVLSPATGFKYDGIRTDSSGIWYTNAHVVGTNATVIVALVPGLPVKPEALKQAYGSSLQQITIAGQPAWHGARSEAPGLFGSSWWHDPFDVEVIGPDLSTTDSVLAGIVAAQPAS